MFVVELEMFLGVTCALMMGITAAPGVHYFSVFHPKLRHMTTQFTESLFLVLVLYT